MEISFIFDSFYVIIRKIYRIYFFYQIQPFIVFKNTCCSLAQFLHAKLSLRSTMEIRKVDVQDADLYYFKNNCTVLEYSITIHKFQKENLSSNGLNFLFDKLHIQP